ncbi:MAG TPA: hypothetical protein VET30_05980, partial [Pseudoxanthomonas sp.]|nr:hypothetical protein [Pseudoxanthomonas sp.]
MTTPATSMAEAVTQEALKAGIIKFVAGASIEITPHDEARLPEVAAYLSPGATVYIAHPPRRQLPDVVRLAIKVQKLGFLARPHILSRELQSERHLRSALTELNAAGIEQILLVAGDQNFAAGPFPSTLEVLNTGATVDCGIKIVGVAGHPEGHPVIGPSLLWDALRIKQSFAERTGIEVQVVTQFGFNPQALFDWQRHAHELDISLPVHVGIAGPTPLPKLIHFAMQCGIGASLRTLMKSTSALTHLARVTST